MNVQLRGLSFRAGIVVAFVVALGLLFFGRGDALLFDRMRALVNGATGPLYEFVGPPIATARTFFADIFRVVEVYQENDRLKAQNAELKAWQAQALALQQKVVSYEALLEMPLEPDIQYRTGRVVDDPGGPFVRTFRVNIGTKDGVVEGQAVMDEHGLVGRIVAAGKQASRILLITDLNSRVPVMIAPTASIHATLVAQKDASPILADIALSSGVARGWRVFIPGDGGSASMGTAVGEVQDVKGNVITVKPLPQYAVAPDSRVAVSVQPPDVRGMLIGQNDSPPVVTYLPKDFRVRPGYRVVTSGNGGLLPPNIPVGEVTEVKGDQVAIKTATAFDSVTYVRVLDYTPPVSDVPHSSKGPPILNQEPPGDVTANATAPLVPPAPMPAPATGRVQ